MANREIRLPLSLGVSCLNDLAVGVIAVPTGLAAVVFFAATTYASLDDAGDGLKVLLGLLAFSVGMVVVGVTSTRRAWRYRPSDLVLDDNGLRIDGGRRHGYTASWSAIASSSCTVKTGGDVYTLRGLLDVAFDGSFDKVRMIAIGSDIVAETDDARENSSFVEIAAALHDRAHPELDVDPPTPAAEPAPAEPTRAERKAAWLAAHPEQRAKKKRGRPDVDVVAEARPVVATPAGLPSGEVVQVTCGACGASVPPSVEAEIACRFCQKPVAMPKELRERVGAAATLSDAARRAERIVVRMLSQPTARVTTSWIAASTLFIAAAWPATVWAYVYLARMHRLDWGIGALVALLPFLLVADGFFVSRLRLVDRIALRSLALTFGANAPARAGDPLTCRSCHAPLPGAATTVVQCVYCGAANVTRVDLRGRARRSESSVRSLQQELEKHQLVRWMWRGATAVGLLSFVATGLVLRHVWHW